MLSTMKPRTTDQVAVSRSKYVAQLAERLTVAELDRAHGDRMDVGWPVSGDAFARRQA